VIFGVEQQRSNSTTERRETEFSRSNVKVKGLKRAKRDVKMGEGGEARRGMGSEWE